MSLQPEIVPLDIKLNPFQLFCHLQLGRGSILLENTIQNPVNNSKSYVFSNPKKIYIYENEKFLEVSDSTYKEIHSNPLDYLQSLYKSYNQNLNQHQTGWLAGFISYDFGLRFENIISNKDALVKMPEIYFGLYDKCFIYDHEKHRWFAAVSCDDEKFLKELEHYNEKFSLDKLICTSDVMVPLKSNFSYDDYLSAVIKVKNYIAAGEVYQVNLTQQFFADTPESPLAIYSKLRKLNPAQYSAFINIDNRRYILSSSPELFLHLDNKNVRTKPIKGTIRRSTDALEDEKMKLQLLASEKDEAELTMIVDLIRNDLNRVCRTNSVIVRHLKNLETYASVHHLVAEIEGELEEKFDIFDLITAAFPGGSITGAPKIRAMQIIDELEPHRRGIYTGAIGYICFNRQAKFNIAIRTIAYDNGKISVGVGGGIVADSIPDREYEETIHKGKTIFQTLGARII